MGWAIDVPADATVDEIASAIAESKETGEKVVRRRRYEGPGDWIPDGLVYEILYGTRAGSEADLRTNLEQACAVLGISPAALAERYERRAVYQAVAAESGSPLRVRT